MFGRFDVEGFLAEIDHDQLCEWIAFDQLEPSGWQAINLATTRLSFLLAQVNSSKKLRERDFTIELAGGKSSSPEAERWRWEAMAARTEIQEQLRGK